ncbi:MAG: hypothetical protein ACK6CU_03435 [Deltaproteobacteria bacterium]
MVAATPGCGLDGFDEALAIELSDRGEELASLRGRAIALELACSTEAFTVRATDGVSGRFVGQRVARSERGLARQLAIVSAELLVALAPRVEPTAGEVVVEEPETSEPETSEPTVDAVARLASPFAPSRRGAEVVVRAALRLEGIAAPIQLLPSGVLGVEVGLDPAMRLVVDAAVGSLERTTSLGEVAAWPVGLTASFRFGGALGDLWLGAGPTLEAAVVVASGRPNGSGVRGDEAALPLVALGAVGTMGVRLAGSPLSIFAELEGSGLVLSPSATLEGTPGPGLDFGPARFGGRLGLGLSL